ncbi:Alr1799 protein, related [Neospora caninum Liverpool]|uniref:Alr1799 protein, related n=1 Tax=Neospora caninum (strain Liverpool) TaxID=572307 RepID=F0VPH3_NEOCL|nr:Alr1799 protein, related [Neospora caninum Liverpool]CBZ55619.1 Alr1799 protein, related [Neospora caninum Liverpool]CEL70361.1 TPA: Alr1799 protein, related [Neospora caninum Liverpool]|eukprot:XP_003885647.1 Alr1799 protein, related [Neospora caninum Liverpool]
MGNTVQSPRGRHYGYSSMPSGPRLDSPLHMNARCGGGCPYPALSSESRYSMMCCQSNGRKMEQFKTREEALATARFYRDRNFDLALHAYSAALDFPSASATPHSAPGRRRVEIIQLSDDLRGPRATDEACEKNSCGDYQRDASLAKAEICSASTALSVGGSNSRLQSEELEGPFEEKGESSAGRAASLPAGVSLIVPLEPREDAPPRLGAGRFFQSSSSSLALECAAAAGAENEADLSNAKICDEIAQLYLSRGDKEDALRYYNRAVNLAPSVVVFIYRRGVVLQLLGQEEAAVLAFRRALQVDPDYKAALFNLGTCLMRREEGREEALCIFQKLAALEPADDQVLSLVAHCYEMDSRFEEALAYRQRVVQLDPQNFRANRELKQLKQQISKENGHFGAARLRKATTVS